MVKFRAAMASDIGAMVPLINAAYRGAGDKRGWTTEEHLVEGARAEPEELREMMGASNARFELAIDDGGALLGSVHLRNEGSSCYLGMLSVDPRQQARGVGRTMLERGEAIAREWGCERMRISVLEVRAELLAYYERRGYRRTGRSFEFPTTNRSSPKIAGIRLVELEKEIG